ncbi:MAG: nucleic acid-binding protein [Lachnospiraceae bacterium]|nr:nucleic acid-binding protein [Lachnospiraceae bacterium]
MRKCLRCDVEMKADFDVKVEGAAYGLKITKPGIFKENLGKVHCAVCPSCGYIEFYLENTGKVSKE